MPCRVSPFGNPRIYAYLQLPAAYRSLSRPSSAPDAKAFSMCSSSLDLVEVRLSAPFALANIALFGDFSSSQKYFIFLGALLLRFAQLLLCASCNRSFVSLKRSLVLLSDLYVSKSFKVSLFQLPFDILFVYRAFFLKKPSRFLHISMLLLTLSFILFSNNSFGASRSWWR